MDVALVMFKADGSRREFPVKKSRIVLGRTSRCDLRIPLSSVSRQHCELRVEDGTVLVRDLGSSNGTYHNDTRIQEAEIAAGDEIVVGPVVFTVVIDGMPDTIEPRRTILQKHASATGVQLASADSRTDVPASSDAPPAEETLDFDDPLTALEALISEESDTPDANKN